MSFIERKEAEKAAQERARAAYAQQVEATRVREAQEAKNRAAIKTAQERQQREQAYGHLHRSGVVNMAQRLASAIDGHVVDTLKGSIIVTWDRTYGSRNIGDTNYHTVSGKEIEISSTPKGTISVKGGGLFGSGSTNLSQEQLKRGDPKLLERALENAYNQPRTLRDISPRTPYDPQGHDHQDRNPFKL